MNILRDDQEQKTHWAQAAVSWGQFLIALVALAGSLFIDRIAYEKRITQIEERQAFVLKQLAQNDAELAQIQVRIERRLDEIQRQLAAVITELAKHQAVSDRMRELNDKAGVRIPGIARP